MAEPFLSEIRIFSFQFAPKGWAMCNGQLLPINQNQGLFSLLGTTFGGDGRINFALPDLRGRIALHTGAGRTLGEMGGEQAHTLTQNEMPIHSHFLQASSSSADRAVAVGSLPAVATSPVYGDEVNLVPLYSATVNNVGGSQAHLNIQPFLTLNFCIALQGIFPSQT
jgi:microcystin-dependent protein